MKHDVPHGHGATDQAANLGELGAEKKKAFRPLGFWDVWDVGGSTGSATPHACKNLVARPAAHDTRLRVSRCLPGRA